MVEQDHAVGDVLLQPLPRERPLPALAGDDGGDPFVLQPPEQPLQLGAQDRLIVEAAEERLDGVEHHALGADAVDGVGEPDEETAEVVLAVLLHLAALDLHVVDDQLLVGDERVEIEAQRADVLSQLGLGLLEGQEHAGLTVIERPADQELQRQQRLSAAGASADQRGTACGKAASRDLVEPVDAARALGQRRVCLAPRPPRFPTSVNALVARSSRRATLKKTAQYRFELPG